MLTKKLFSLALLLAFSLFSLSSWAQLSVVSGNGFQCIKNPDSLITCQGHFPGVRGLVGASGYQRVSLVYDPDTLPRLRYVFDSSTGCLMQMSLDSAGRIRDALVHHAAGPSQRFSFPLQEKQAYQFCGMLK